jgi:hypothetical protein
MRTLTPARSPSDPDARSPERRLLAADPTPGRALLGTDPALGAGTSWSHPVLLLEPVEALTVIDPPSGQVREMQAELLVRQGFHRFRMDDAEPAPLAGWTVRRTGGRLQVRDRRGDPWAYTSARPAPGWLAEAQRLGRVLVVYGTLVGVRPPRGVTATQYGPWQRAAELSAGRSRGLVAAALLGWES